MKNKFFTLILIMLFLLCRDCIIVPAFVFADDAAIAGSELSFQYQGEYNGFSEGYPNDLLGIETEIMAAPMFSENGQIWGGGYIFTAALAYNDEYLNVENCSDFPHFLNAIKTLRLIE